MNTLTPELIAAAGFPGDLADPLQRGVIIFSHARPDGTLEFIVPDGDKPMSAFSLVWHPENPATWDYDDLRFYVKEEKFRDLAHHEPLAAELIGLALNGDETVADLVGWLDDYARAAAIPQSGTEAGRRATITETCTYEVELPAHVNEENWEAWFCAQDIHTFPVTVQDREIDMDLPSAATAAAAAAAAPPSFQLPSPEQLARTFSAHLLAAVGPADLAEAARRNATETDPGTCHSHDFCDANVMMAAAFQELTGVDPGDTNPALDGRHMPGMADEVGALWTAAWTLAKTQRFYLTP